MPVVRYALVTDPFYAVHHQEQVCLEGKYSHPMRLAYVGTRYYYYYLFFYFFKYIIITIILILIIITL